MVGKTLKINVNVSTFALYHLYNFSGFHLNGPCSGQLILDKLK